MAKPKVKIKVEIVNDTFITVWAKDAHRHIPDVESIEGVHFASSSGRLMIIYTDPRYDVNEVAREIEQLLSAEMPEVFRE